MKLTGSYKLNVKKNVVWKALNDANILKQCIPGCESFEKEDYKTFNVTATNQIGPMNATFSGKITFQVSLKSLENSVHKVFVICWVNIDFHLILLKKKDN